MSFAPQNLQPPGARQPLFLFFHGLRSDALARQTLTSSNKDAFRALFEPSVMNESRARVVLQWRFQALMILVSARSGSDQASDGPSSPSRPCPACRGIHTISRSLFYRDTRMYVCLRPRSQAEGRWNQDRRPGDRARAKSIKTATPLARPAQKAAVTVVLPRR